MEKVNIPNEQSAIEERRLKQNWVLSVKQLLSRLGLMDVRFFQGFANIKLFIDNNY